MKSRVTLFSMDKNSYPTLCPDDCMHRKGRARGYVWWMLLNEDESEAWEPLDHWLCWVRHQANAFRWAWQHTQHKGAKGNNSLKNECSTEILVTNTSVMIVTGRLFHIIWSRKWHNLVPQTLMCESSAFI